MTLETMLAELCCNSEIENAVLQKIRKNEKEIEKISRSAYQGEDFNFALCGRMPLTRLAVVTYLLLRKYDDHKAKGTPDKIIFDTFRDVSLRAKLYYEKTVKVPTQPHFKSWHLIALKCLVLLVALSRYKILLGFALLTEN